MKTRNGFVSNSSSSSFILFGIKTPKNFPWEKAAKLFGDTWPEDEDEQMDYIWNNDHLNEACEGEYIGVKFNAYDGDIKKVPIGELMERIEKAKKLFSDIGIKDEINLIFGEEAC